MPSSFDVDDDASCVTISSPHLPGVLQLSGARKDTGDVDTDDLLDFAQDDIAIAGQPATVALPAFKGLSLTLEADGVTVRKWWLASGRLLVFATYTSQRAIGLPDLKEVTDLLSTLRPNSGQS